ncbi:MAG: ATP synthase F1 subunit gamma [bacterium]
MAKAKILVKRRKSVRNTRKITGTMEMVSTAKYKKSFTRIQASAPYQEKLREVMSDLAGASIEVEHPLLESRTVKRTLILLITSNRGLCGGYNSNLCMTTRDLLVSERAAGADVELHVVGKKGIQYFRHRGEKLAAANDRFGDRYRFADVNALADDYIRRYSAHEVDKVVVVYQKFFSAGRQKPVADMLLPLDATIAGGPPAGDPATAPATAAAVGTAGGAVPAAAAGTGSREKNYIFSPDPASLLRELLPAYVKTTLWNDFLQSSVGEHLARMLAMKNATDAADKLIRRLTRAYNRARQSQITNEIAELMGGVEALK